MFETHKELALDLLKALYERVLPDWLSEDPQKQNKEKQKLAIYILDDAIEHLGLAILGNEFYSNCMHLFLKYVPHPNPEHRQAAVYGLGVASMNADAADGTNAFVPYSQQCFEALVHAASIPPPKSTKVKKIRQWGHAHDNAIAAMGKTIKAL